jgi:hypothetical protein
MERGKRVGFCSDRPGWERLLICWRPRSATPPRPRCSTCTIAAALP